MANEKVVVIIPTYNEKGNIERVIEILEKEIFPKIPSAYAMHILVVDDNSPDGTGDEVKYLMKGCDNLHLFRNPKKAGLGNAYTKGMREALTKLKADIVFEFDADLSHDPTKIPQMLEMLQEGADMVVGSRYIPGGGIPANWGLHRKFLSVVGNLIIQLVITDFTLHDWTGGFRAIRRKVVEAVLPTIDSAEFMGYTFQIGFLFQARRKGFVIRELPFKFKDRTMGKSKMPASYITTILSYILKVRIAEVVKNRIFKFVVVGGIGAVVQLTGLKLLEMLMEGKLPWSDVVVYQIAYFLSVELAVVSNFIWSNLWTFSDRKLEAIQIPGKFIQFNLASAGSIGIQQVLAFIGAVYIGLFDLFTLPLIGMRVGTDLIYAVAGILIGMFWNFFAYSRIIWKAKVTSKS